MKISAKSHIVAPLVLAWVLHYNTMANFYVIEKEAILCLTGHRMLPQKCDQILQNQSKSHIRQNQTNTTSG